MTLIRITLRPIILQSDIIFYITYLLICYGFVPMCGLYQLFKATTAFLVIILFYHILTNVINS